MTARGRDIDRLVGARLRQARVLRGLTMEDVARAVGVSVPAVQKWESGRSALSATRLVQLREAFGIAPSELLGGEDGMDMHNELIGIARLVRNVASRLARERAR